VPFVSVIRRVAPLVALAAAGAVAARRRAAGAADSVTPYEPASAPDAATSQAEPPLPPQPGDPVAATDAEVVRSVYDAPPVEDPVEENIEDPLEEEAPVDRSDTATGADPATVTDVVDDLLAPLPSEDEIEDATVVDDEPGAGDSPPGDYAR